MEISKPERGATVEINTAEFGDDGPAVWTFDGEGWSLKGEEDMLDVASMEWLVERIESGEEDEETTVKVIEPKKRLSPLGPKIRRFDEAPDEDDEEDFGDNSAARRAIRSQGRFGGGGVKRRRI